MFDLPKYGDGVCLARLSELLEKLGVDRSWLSRVSVVVTGSNGKGSTAAFCASIGRAFGLRTGLFTSPHLYCLNERFQIDGNPITDDNLRRLGSRIEAAIAEIPQDRAQAFGSFEAMFALACLFFQESACDFAVFEAGIGGRYDPVRLIGARETCVTSVDYEHTELLGQSLELIASDKSDACASGGTIIYGENCRSIRAHLLEYNRYRNVDTLFVRDEIGIGEESIRLPMQHFDFRFGATYFPSLEVNLSGAFQFNNAAIATSLFLLWVARARPRDEAGAIEAAVRAGLRNARWPGRLETIQQTPLTVIDVGHTPDAIVQSLASLKALYGDEGWILVVGISNDKNARDIVKALAPSFDTIICTSAQHKGTKAETIAATVCRTNPEADVHVAATVQEALDLSVALATASGSRIYVAGGLFLAVEYATVLHAAGIRRGP